LIDSYKEIKAGIDQLIKNSQSRILSYQASETPSKLRKQLLRSCEVNSGYIQSQISLMTSNPSNRNTFIKAIKDMYIFMNQNLTRNNIDESTVVQPYVKDVFLPSTLSCLKTERVEIENEREYEYMMDEPFIDNESKESKVRLGGKTDHTLKYPGFDIRCLTIEDKCIGCSLSDAGIGQLVSHMMYEIKQFEHFLIYIPEQFWGILHNGIEWVFVVRRLITGKVIWNHVKFSPPMESKKSKKTSEAHKSSDKFVTESDELESYFSQVAQYWDHIYYNCDIIFIDIQQPVKAIAASSLLTTNEKDNDDDDDEDYDNQDPDNDQEDDDFSRKRRKRDDDDDDDYDRNVKMLTTKSSSSSSTKNINSKMAYFFGQDNENRWLPLSRSVVAKLPIQLYKRI
jgi:hypothetical protein